MGTGTVLNPEATPWSPLNTMLPHMLYSPSPLLSQQVYYYDPSLSSSLHHQPPPPPPWLPHHHPVPLYNIMVHSSSHHHHHAVASYYHQPPHPDMQAIPPSQHHKKVERTFSSDGRKKASSGVYLTTPTRFTRLKKTSSTVTKAWRMKGPKPHNNHDDDDDDDDDGGGDDGDGDQINYNNDLEEVLDEYSGSSIIAAAHNKNTSVMIRNIPNNFRRGDLLRFLDYYCTRHRLEYDFFYLPMDFMSGKNLGYAFANFTTSSGASKIMSVLNGHKWSANPSLLQHFSSKKICQLTWARIQGKAELVNNFQQSKFWCDDTEYLPVVFSPPRDGSSSLSNPSILGDLRGNHQLRV